MQTNNTTFKTGFNWGHGIALLYCSFAALILFMVYKASMQRSDLVAPDYYKQELSYQEKLIKTLNYNNAKEKIEFEQSVNLFKLKCNVAGPDKVIGTVNFYKPDNKAMDRKFDIHLDSKNVFLINTGDLNKGIYLVQLDYSIGRVKFYHEETIHLQ